MMSILVLLLLCIFFMSSACMSSCIEKERRALLDVKANIVDDFGNPVLAWGSEEEKMDCCKWMGVTCNNRTGHVIELDLTFYDADVIDPCTVITHFKGKISRSLVVLNQLQRLNLNSINFQSKPLPNFLGSLSNLRHLHVSGANLSGPIPHQLVNLSNLVHVDLSCNSLVGSIPFSFGDLTSLTYLNLSQNRLGGVIPKSFGNSSSLVNLDLSQNHFYGSLPKFARCSSLIKMSLAHNALNGSMTNFTRCTSLQNLDLSSNFLTGSLPDNMGQLSNLQYLDVSHNSLSGSIPNFIGCPSLWYLDISSNRLFGNVPKSLGQLSNLEYLDISSNLLEGVISEVHFLNLTRLDYLDLSFNYNLELNLSFYGSTPFQLSTIKLQSCKLGPKFPTWLKTQLYFTHLDISSSRISDEIPTWFWNLPSQLNFLNLSSNEIKGLLPHMPLLFNGFPGIDLSNNHFKGNISLLPFLSLSALNLSGNRFSGTLSFLCKVDTPLTFLDLSNNSFSGSLPHCQLKFHDKIVVLSVSNNNLSGKIPSSFGFLVNLEALYMRTNNFVGKVPMSLSKCTKLRFLDLGENKLSGVIPGWIGEKLSKLYVLVLGSNRFYGRLPSQLCWLYNLQVLDLSNNALSHNIPQCFANFTAMATRSFGGDMIFNHSYSSFVGQSICVKIDPLSCPDQPREVAQFLDNALVMWKGTERSFERSGLQLLKSIDLSRNNLSEKLPYEITRLHDLASLNLSINKLHGEVPKDIGNLTALQSLDLSSNEFSGQIPSSLVYLTFLSYLNLSYNNLSGRIPQGTQLQSFNDTSYTGNPQLCGLPLTQICGLPPVVENKDVKEDEDDFWKTYYTGLVVGFTTGFLGICVALVLSTRWRYFFFASLGYMKDWIYVIVAVNFRKLERKFRT